MRALRRQNGRIPVYPGPILFFWRLDTHDKRTFWRAPRLARTQRLRQREPTLLILAILVGLGKVSRELAPQACRRIQATGVDVLGLICNQVNFPSRLNDYGYEYGYYYHYAYANASQNSSSYGKYGKGIGRYARGVGNYVRRYRDSYLSDRYIRDGSGADVQRYHEEGVSRELGQSKLKSGNGANLVNGTNPSDQANQPTGSDRSSSDGGSGNPPTSGGAGWLKKLPFRR